MKCSRERKSTEWPARALIGALLGSGALLGCPPKQSEPRTASDAEPATEKETEPSEEPAATEAAESSEGESEASTEASSEPHEGSEGSDDAKATAAKNDLRQVLQLVLDDEELNPYWHFGEPGHLPVPVAGDFPPDLGLVKANKPVKFVEGVDPKKNAVFVFTDIKIAGNEANVRYRYDVQSVRGSAVLKKGNGRWELTRSRVTRY